MKKILSNILDWIYKKKCYFCGSSKESTKMCSNCYSEMTHLPLKKDREILGIKVFCSGIYESNLQKLIRGIKYHNQPELAYFQAKFMHQYWAKLLDKKEKYQVIPIPLFKTREKSRRYNHMKLIAERFCELTGYELNLELVKRVKDTKPQYKLTRAQRMENLANAFLIDKKACKNLPVLLIDDICTTGTTFENIIMGLKKEDINDIICFATTTPFFDAVK